MTAMAMTMTPTMSRVWAFTTSSGLVARVIGRNLANGICFTSGIRFAQRATCGGFKSGQRHESDKNEMQFPCMDAVQQRESVLRESVEQKRLIRSNKGDPLCEYDGMDAILEYTGRRNYGFSRYILGSNKDKSKDQRLHKQEQDQEQQPKLVREQQPKQLREQQPKQLHEQQPKQLHEQEEQHPEPHSTSQFNLDLGDTLERVQVAFETWGTLNSTRSNAILLLTGLSGSSHARSHSHREDPGWWEHMIGPGKPLDTDRFFVVCCNVLGGCFGSSGPSSLHPRDNNPYGTRFPIITIADMARAQFQMLNEHLGIDSLFACVGGSMGGMLALQAGIIANSHSPYISSVGRVISISGAARCHPICVALHHVQRQLIMMDPNWNRGFYYDSVPPHVGLKLAREVSTTAYRSADEWMRRFGNRRADAHSPYAFCPEFLIETYLDYAGEKFCMSYDANSLLYISKAMDMFDLSAPKSSAGADSSFSSSEPRRPNTPSASSPQQSPKESLELLADAMRALKETPTLVVGINSDALLPVSSQREIADALRLAGSRSTTYLELTGQNHGHDTFLVNRPGEPNRIADEISKFLN